MPRSKTCIKKRSRGHSQVNRSRFKMHGNQRYITDYKEQSQSHDSQMQTLGEHFPSVISHLVSEYASDTVEEGRNIISKGYMVGDRKEGRWTTYAKKSGKVIEEIWYRDGQVHRDDGPAYIAYQEKKDKIPKEKIWFQYGEEKGLNNGLYRELYYLSGIVKQRDYGNPLQYRKEMRYYPNGELQSIHTYYGDSLWSKGNKPAVVMYREDGTIDYEQWYRSGRLHRKDAPASVYYNPDGTVRNEEWWYTENQPLY